MMMDVGEIGHFEFCSDKLKIEKYEMKGQNNETLLQQKLIT
jgi:hypothetical protein